MTETESKSDTKKSVFQKFKGIKHFEIIIAVILIGVVLVIFIGNFTGNDATTNENTFAEWCGKQEKKMCEVLSKIDGAGKVTVMITYESGVNKVYAYESTSKTVNGVTTVTEELIYNSGKPILVKEEAPKVRGVVVVADGAQNTAVKLALVKAVLALVEVSPGNIEIFASK